MKAKNVKFVEVNLNQSETRKYYENRIKELEMLDPIANEDEIEAIKMLLKISEETIFACWKTFKVSNKEICSCKRGMIERDTNGISYYRVWLESISFGRMEYADSCKACELEQAAEYKEELERTEYWDDSIIMQNS